ncbi:ubiquitin-like protein, partial [Triplophysa rosa]
SPGQDSPLTSSETESHVNGVLICYVVVLQHPAGLQLPAVKNEPLLVHRDSFFIVDLTLELIHCLVGINIVGARYALLILDKHLHGSRGRDEERNRGPCVQSVTAEASGIIVEVDSLTIICRQLLLNRVHIEVMRNEQLQMTNCSIAVHRQTFCVSI